jgi:hypothetical protein
LATLSSMKAEIFTLCDAATDAQGKLNLLGSFDTLWAKEAPVTHPACAVAIRLRFAHIEEGNHRVKLTFADADGKLVMPPMNASLAVRFKPEDSTATANLVINLQQVKLPQFGEYTIDLAVDGRQEGSIPLYVRKIPERPSDPALQ